MTFLVRDAGAETKLLPAAGNVASRSWGHR